MNSVLVEFEDGYRVITSRYAVRMVSRKDACFREGCGHEKWRHLYGPGSTHSLKIGLCTVAECQCKQYDAIPF